MASRGAGLIDGEERLSVGANLSAPSRDAIGSFDKNPGYRQEKIGIS